MTDAQVIVVGGGPAGASTAFSLASRGVDVRVLDRARFPRSKPCAECLSPQASRILHTMGALDAVMATNPAALAGFTVRTPGGAEIRGRYDAVPGHRAFSDRGLAVRREVLDTILLDRARAAGARVEEGVHVVNLVRDARGRVTGVVVRAEDGAVRTLAARVVVGADGLNSMTARRLGVAHRHRWPRRVALVAHYEGVRGITELGEMHVARDGFVGIADVGGGVTAVAAVFPARRARAIQGDRNAFLDAWLQAQPHLASRFAPARRTDAARAVGPFASHARRASAPGALLVGDAADFFDPFTGEGIYSALRGGELAAEFAAAALESGGDGGDGDDRRALAEYDRALRREFRDKWRVERAIGAVVARPRLISRVGRACEARPALAHLLVGVCGDFVPPARVMQMGFLLSLFARPLPAAHVAHPA